MKIFTGLALSGLVFLGCSKGNEGDGNRPEAQGTTSSAADPTGKPLAHHLDTAVAATVVAVNFNTGGGGAEKTKTQVLDESATKAYLGRLDLSQLPNGPVAKCPSDTLVELADGGGKLLGTIGFCQGKAALLIGPDGMTIGGIRASLP
jgi:hypothetical protein